MSSDGGFGGIGLNGLNFQAQMALQKATDRKQKADDTRARQEEYKLD